VKKKVKKAVNYLQTCYSNGIIPYPRVDNNFITIKGFDVHPHPQMPSFNKYTTPLNFNEYKINKKNSLLFLSVIRAVSPSNVDSMSGFIDDIFTDELGINNGQEERVGTIEKLTEEFFQSRNLTNKKILDWFSEPYEEIKKCDTILFNQDELFFDGKKPMLLSSFQKSTKKKQKKEDKIKKQEEKASYSVQMREFSSIEEAIADFKRRIHSEEEIFEEKLQICGK